MVHTVHAPMYIGLFITILYLSYTYLQVSCLLPLTLISVVQLAVNTTELVEPDFYNNNNTIAINYTKHEICAYFQPVLIPSFGVIYLALLNYKQIKYNSLSFLLAFKIKNYTNYIFFTDYWKKVLVLFQIAPLIKWMNLYQ